MILGHRDADQLPAASGAGLAALAEKLIAAAQILATTYHAHLERFVRKPQPRRNCQAHPR